MARNNNCHKHIKFCPVQSIKFDTTLKTSFMTLNTWSLLINKIWLSIYYWLYEHCNHRPTNLLLHSSYLRKREEKSHEKKSQSPTLPVIWGSQIDLLTGHKMAELASGSSKALLKFCLCFLYDFRGLSSAPAMIHGNMSGL